ncbi:hypothetical protein EDD11_007243 [Mortierella claussenii]|nr:hypothetical protein EDD11_007243 [Mortierella claussenii]
MDTTTSLPMQQQYQHEQHYHHQQQEQQNPQQGQQHHSQLGQQQQYQQHSDVIQTPSPTQTRPFLGRSLSKRSRMDTEDDVFEEAGSSASHNELQEAPLSMPWEGALATGVERGSRDGVPTPVSIHQSPPQFYQEHGSKRHKGEWEGDWSMTSGEGSGGPMEMS